MNMFFLKLFSYIVSYPNKNHLGRAFAPFRTQWNISGQKTTTKYQRPPRVLRLVTYLRNSQL